MAKKSCRRKENDMIKVTVPKDRKEIEKQIRGLRYLLFKDTDNKSREIHQTALWTLNLALAKLKLKDVK